MSLSNECAKETEVYSEFRNYWKIILCDVSCIPALYKDRLTLYTFNNLIPSWCRLKNHDIQNLTKFTFVWLSKGNIFQVYKVCFVFIGKIRPTDYTQEGLTLYMYENQKISYLSVVYTTRCRSKNVNYTDPL